LLFAADGDERRVKVYVPDPPPTKKVPLVLYFHPAGGTPSSSVLETRFDDLAGRKGFIVAFPQSAGSYWDVAVTEGTTDSDIDERYVAALVDKLIADLPIDPDRVFVTGFSMGAVMADRVACRLTDRIKAAAIVSGTSWVGGPCKPSRPISVAIVHGSGDSTFPYKSAEQQDDEWRARDGCATEGTAEPLGDSATIRRATGCRGGTTVEFVTVQGGGHSWFGKPDATTFVWEFFEDAARR
jgi:polyhydroxybutyrate depolymerase